MNVAQKYFKAKDDLFKHVGLPLKWEEFPIDNSTDMYWRVFGDTVFYSEDKKDIKKYSDIIIMEFDMDKEDFVKQIYRGSEFTIIACNPQTDFTKWYKVFDNRKEIK